MINNEENLELEIENLKKENTELQNEVINDVKIHSDLIIKNMELEEENKHLKEENEILKKEIQQTEKVILEVADKLYQKEFNS